MDKEAWWVTVHGVTRVRQDLVTKLPPSPLPVNEWTDLSQKLILPSLFLQIRIDKQPLHPTCFPDNRQA